MALPSIFDRSAAEQLVDRLRTLTPTSKAQWGKMDVAQMMAHCQPPIRVALGELRLKRMFLGRLLGWMVRKSATGEAPFKRGLPTSPVFIVSDARTLAVEQPRLVTLIERLQQGGAAGLTKLPHPFFGVLTDEEWDHTMWKHLDHHLRQFGA